MISKIILILLIVVGLAGLGIGLDLFGDFRVFSIGFLLRHYVPMTFSGIGIIGILSGIGFWRIQNEEPLINTPSYTEKRWDS